MKTVASHVETFMREYPYLSKFLRQGIVNYKALARKIEPEISDRTGEKVSVGSIAVALQRLHHRDKDKIYSMIGRLKGVKVISDIAVYETVDAANSYRLVADLLVEHNFDAAFAVVVKADTETLLLVEKMLELPLLKIATLTGVNITKLDQTLTGLIITRELLENSETGGLSYPLQVLAEHGILVKGVSASFNEELILVGEADADRAASILRKAMWR